MRQTDLNIKSGRIEVNSFGVTLNRGICQQPWNYFYFNSTGADAASQFCSLAECAILLTEIPSLTSS